MKNKDAIPKKLLWIDLEMTGLDSANDVILELAMEITDFQLKTVETYESTINQERELVLDRMQANVWWKDYPDNRNAFVSNLDKGKSLSQVEEDVCKLVEKHFGKDPAILAGNSIHNDRDFIKQYLPALDLKLHYRMLDVSAWKVFMQGRFKVKFSKPEVHRAFEDIQGSIAELDYYLDWFKNHESQDS